MKRLLALCLTMLLLGGCAMEPVLSDLFPPEEAPSAASGDAPPHPAPEDDDPDYDPDEVIPVEDEDDWEEDGVPIFSTVYSPPDDLDPWETVEAYLEQHYLSYTNLTYIDMTSIFDMSVLTNRKIAQWQELLAQRRRLLAEYDLCYVETEWFPWEITWLDASELTDQRISFWQERGAVADDELLLHFVITGEAGQAYTPLFALNSQHTVRLRELDGIWKITYHYFPGSVRKFGQSNLMNLRSDDDLLEDLLREFAPVDAPPAPTIPAGAYPYDAALSVDYALAYTEQPNPDFYHVGDWMGNCMNFISQCLYAGFGELKMTAGWYSGGGGGSPAWENVNHFWNDITSPGGLQGQVLEGVHQLQMGDIIQTRSLLLGADEGTYNHALLVIDEETLLLAQNSPACFVYYADLFNVETRLVRPTALQ